MTRRLAWGAVFAGIAVSLAVSRSVSQSAAGPTTIISLVGTNDLHGGLFAHDGRGGLDVFAGYLRNLRAARAKDGGAVLLVDAGDMFQGTLESNTTEGAPVVDAYNALGYAAAAIGNHEFDFGPVGPAATPRAAADDPRGALKARAASAGFPFLAANLIDDATGRPVAWPNVRPSVVVSSAGIRLGIIGVMTAGALAATISLNTTGLTVAPPAAAIRGEAASLRSVGAGIVIVAAHAGARCTRFDAPDDLSSCTPEDAEIMDVVRALPAGTVDAVVAGHTHAGMAHRVGGVPVIESYSGGRAFGRVDLVVDTASGRVTDTHVFPPHDICARVDPASGRCDTGAPSPRATSDRYEGATVAPDRAVTALLAPVRDRVHDLQTASLGVTLDTPLRRAPVFGAESALGNLFTEAFLAAVPGADVAVNNTMGGLRTDLPAGPITYGQLFEVFPFDNLLGRLTLTGSEFRRVVTGALRQSRPVPGIAGLSVEASCQGTSLVVTLRRPSGALVRDTDRLTVVTTDFLATGGNRLFTPVTPESGLAFTPGPVARDVVADYLRRRGGHLDAAGLVDRAHPRWTYPGRTPVRCARAA